MISAAARTLLPGRAMRRASRFVLPLLLSFALAAAACSDASSSSSVAPSVCRASRCGPDPVPPAPFGLTIENRSESSVEVTIRAEPSLRVEHGILDGSISVPFPVEKYGAPMTVPLAPGSQASLGNSISVVGGPPFAPIPSSTSGSSSGSFGGSTSRLGGFVRLRADGPWFFVVGLGRLFVRSRDGALVLEAEDPRTLTVMPAERDVAECTAGVLDAPFDDPPTALLYTNGSPRVAAVSESTAGCRVVSIREEYSSATYELRMCLPDGAWPFAADDTIAVGPAGTGHTSTLHFSNDKGDTLEVINMAFFERRSVAVEGLALQFDEDVTCHRVNTDCGDVDVPAKIAASVQDSSVKQTVTFGQPFTSLDGKRTFYVLGARARPVSKPGCVGRTNTNGGARANAYVAVVQRAS